MMKVLVQGGLLVAAVMAIGWAVLFGPHYADYWQMEDVVGTSALSWAAFDVIRAKSEFNHEIERLGIDSLTVDDCSFQETGGLKTVNCQWHIDVEIPLVGQTRRIYFEMEKSANPDGRLED